jgi:hypothetical protein
MTSGEVAAYIAGWQPVSVPPQAAAFARDVIAAVAPEGRERAKNLLWAAGKLADYALGLGLDAVPEVLLHPSVTERFTRAAPGLSGVARRTLRTSLRFIGRRVVPQFYPADVPHPSVEHRAAYDSEGGFLAHCSLGRGRGRCPDGARQCAMLAGDVSGAQAGCGAR